MNIRYGLLTALLPASLALSTCTGSKPPPQDLVNDRFPEAQAELREVMSSIGKDLATANFAGIQAHHLDSDKFTKFGPRDFKRQDVTRTNESEAAFFRSISDFNQEITDLKIDVFGDIAVVTHYADRSFVQDGEERVGRGRQTLVFLRTGDGWKIVHEHGTAEF